MSSPARAVHNNSEAIKRVQHLTDAAVLLWPDAPHLAQYYLFRMQQAAEKDNLKIPHRTASKICSSCGGLVTSKVRLLSAKRRSRRSAQLAARETKSQLNMMLGHANTTDTEPSAHLRNVLHQHCARCDHKRLLIAFQHDPVRTVTPVKRSAAPSMQHNAESTLNKSHNNTAPSLKRYAHNTNNNNNNSHANNNNNNSHPNNNNNNSHPNNNNNNSHANNSSINSHADYNNTTTVHHTAVTNSVVSHTKNTKNTAGPNTKNTAGPNTKNTNTSHPNKNKHSMKNQVAKMLHETKNSSKKKNVQDNLKQFLNSINM